MCQLFSGAQLFVFVHFVHLSFVYWGIFVCCLLVYTHICLLFVCVRLSIVSWCTVVYCLFVYIYLLCAWCTYLSVVCWFTFVYCLLVYTCIMFVFVHLFIVFFLHLFANSKRLVIKLYVNIY